MASRVFSKCARRAFHNSSRRYAITNMQMPAMSPTMTEGGIASWKKKDGEPFSAGDVLLEIETDKATIDVEAQDDGFMGKIIKADGSKNVAVGQIIAILAEEGDDISNLEIPKDDPPPKQHEQEKEPTSASQTGSSPPESVPPSQPPTPKKDRHPKHPKPLFPSVHRLLVEHDIPNPEEIKGTGVRGMLTKGDVLAFLGKASSPTGTFDATRKEVQPAVAKKDEPVPLDGLAIRKLIVSTMVRNALVARNSKLPPTPRPTFDSIIADYLPPPSKSQKGTLPLSVPKPSSSPSAYFDGLI